MSESYQSVRVPASCVSPLPRVPASLDLVKGYLQRSGIDKPGVCHLFRHTMATQMLENGADLRYIQAMLGHAKLETTAIYTQVAIGQLKAVYERTHPGAGKKDGDGAA